MKKDLDQLMKEQEIDVLFVIGALQNNPDMIYFSDIHHVDNAHLFKIQRKEPILFLFVDMEREEAESSGLETHSYFSKKSLSNYLEENNGDLILSTAVRIKEAMLEIGLTKGRVAISGVVDLGYGISLIEQLKAISPEFQFIGFEKDSVIEQARMTKSPAEIERIRVMGKITTEVVSRVRNFLQTQITSQGILISNNGIPITVKDIKSRIRMWLAELGADNPEDTIFSIGRDCAIPHNSGTPDDVIKLGVPIVFDIFPCERGGGYFYDFTRTWCLEYATDEVIQMHQQVLEVHHKIINTLYPRQTFRSAQVKTCQLFSEMGHNTIAQKNNLTEGYVHSVGHGLGLNVHEKPFSGITASPDDLLIPGVVFTIEPGLYYPKKEIGIRIEDTLYLNDSGQFEIIAKFPYDLIIPMKK